MVWFLVTIYRWATQLSPLRAIRRRRRAYKEQDEDAKDTAVSGLDDRGRADIDRLQHNLRVSSMPIMPSSTTWTSGEGKLRLNEMAEGQAATRLPGKSNTLPDAWPQPPGHKRCSSVTLVSDLALGSGPLRSATRTESCSALDGYLGTYRLVPRAERKESPLERFLKQQQRAPNLPEGTKPDLDSSDPLGLFTSEGEVRPWMLPEPSIYAVKAKPTVGGDEWYA